MNKVKMYCPFCDSEHDIIIKEFKSECLIKDEKVEFTEKKYYCEKYDDEFADGDLIEQNLKNAHEQYRIKHHLLTSIEIKDIRDKYKLSQADLSLILGWGEITITRYETKEIQNENYDTTLRNIKDNPYNLYNYFLLNKDKFSKKKQIKIANKIFNVILDTEENNRYIELSFVKKHFSLIEKN